MPLFAIIAHDPPGRTTVRDNARPAHQKYLDPFRGKIVLGGPFTDEAGNLIVVDMATKEEAEEFARNDPYMTQGVHDRVEVHPFRQAVPAK
ncbi:MAG: YciI family protein [Candidatus Binataceae bacterium]